MCHWELLAEKMTVSPGFQYMLDVLAAVVDDAAAAAAGARRPKFLAGRHCRAHRQSRRWRLTTT